MKSILMTGASGFIGQVLAKRLQAQGFRVVSLTRNPSYQSENSFYWDPNRDELPLSPLEGLEGVIHLAGESIAALRWSKQKKDRIFLSRVRSSWLLSHALLRVKTPPRFFFSASAVGYYGSCGNEILTEESRQGIGFLADVCGKWEKASSILKQNGVRVIYGRFGNVLDPSGGILKNLIPVFKWGLGARLGDGSQWISWISREDLARAILWILFSTHLEGPVNCSSPHPIHQKEWVQTLAQALHRPAIWKIPKPIVRLLFGEMGQELFLSSLRVQPAKLLESGFSFQDPFLQGYFKNSTMP